MPQLPSFSLNGGPVFANTSVSFEVAFVNPADQALVQAYEWYLDGVIVIDAEGGSFSGQIACGVHVIGVRLLYNNTWSGTQELSFATCKTVTSAAISGPGTLIAGQSAVYRVILTFADGTTADVTDRYTLTATADGSSSSGNVLTATGNAAGDAMYTVTLTADDGDGSPLSKVITIDNQAGILVVDLYYDTSLNVIGLVDNAEVTDNHVPAYTGANTIPAGMPPATVLILASDLVNQTTLKWRFVFNLAQLKTNYPATTDFVFYIKGRSAVAGNLSGSYNLKNEATTMIMPYVPGNYLPSTSGGGQVGQIQSFSVPVVSGANGSYLEADLTTILRFDYSVASNSITYTHS